MKEKKVLLGGLWLPVIHRSHFLYVVWLIRSKTHKLTAGIELHMTVPLNVWMDCVLF